MITVSSETEQDHMMVTVSSETEQDHMMVTVSSETEVFHSIRAKGQRTLHGSQSGSLQVYDL